MGASVSTGASPQAAVSPAEKRRPVQLRQFAGSREVGCRPRVPGSGGGPPGGGRAVCPSRGSIRRGSYTA